VVWLCVWGHPTSIGPSVRAGTTSNRSSLPTDLPSRVPRGRMLGRTAGTAGGPRSEGEGPIMPGGLGSSDHVQVTSQLRDQKAPEGARPSYDSPAHGHADGSMLARVHDHLDKNIDFLKKALAD
jgi:hypothetical protein